MKRSLLACLLGIVVTTAAAAQPVRVNVAFQAPLSQFCEVVLGEALRRLERPLVVRSDLPAERAILRVSQGKDHADCMRVDGIRAMYPDLIQVPTPVFEVEFVAFTRQGTMLKPGWEGLRPYRVGAVKGWKLIESQVLAVQPRAFVQVGTADSLFRMLALGRVDVVALNRLDGERKLRELKLAGIAAAAEPLAAVPLYVTLHRSQGELARQLDSTFLVMRRDGSWERARRQVFQAGGAQ